jgi:predicted porin
LKANFQLEQGFGLDTGAAADATKAFSRQAWVGFSGGFGEVQLGKAYNAFDDVSALAASTFDSDLAPINNVFVSTAFANAYDNTVKYASPSFGGFSGAVSYSFGENKDLPAAGPKHSADSIYSISGKYENGPLSLGLGYAKDKSSDPADLYNVKAVRLAGAYDLGMAKLLATYGRVTEGDAKVTEYEIGADVPLSAAMTLSAGYARSKATEPAILDAKANSFGVAVAYSLSKRTTAYAGLNRTTGEQGANEAKASIYAIGVKHTF